MVHGAENENNIYFARKGYYKGKPVTITHRDGDRVWLEDYKQGEVYGIWVENKSVRYTE